MSDVTVTQAIKTLSYTLKTGVNENSILRGCYAASVSEWLRKSRAIIAFILKGQGVGLREPLDTRIRRLQLPSKRRKLVTQQSNVTSQETGSWRREDCTFRRVVN
jgi:hypothetical protein